MNSNFKHFENKDIKFKRVGAPFIGSMHTKSDVYNTGFNWNVKYDSGTILSNKEIEDVLIKSNLTSLPEMTFNSNLSLFYSKRLILNFNAIDALQDLVDCSNIKVSYSEKWQKTRLTNDTSKRSSESNPNKSKLKSDKGDNYWTFETEYIGKIQNIKNVIRDNDSELDYDKLIRKDKILFYKELILYEDELGDNGIAICQVKIRIMENNGFFILFSNYVRVDNVYCLLRECRYQHIFGTNYLMRENITLNDPDCRVNKIADMTKINSDLNYVKQIMMSGTKCDKQRWCEKIYLD